LRQYGHGPQAIIDMKQQTKQADTLYAREKRIRELQREELGKASQTLAEVFNAAGYPEINNRPPWFYSNNMDNSPSKTPILENLGKMFSKLLSHEELSDIEN
jgi:hypothetical protein